MYLERMQFTVLQLLQFRREWMELKKQNAQDMRMFVYNSVDMRRSIGFDGVNTRVQKALAIEIRSISDFHSIDDCVCVCVCVCVCATECHSTNEH